MVPIVRIGLTTPSLPMTCSTTELYRHYVIWANYDALQLVQPFHKLAIVRIAYVFIKST